MKLKSQKQLLHLMLFACSLGMWTWYLLCKVAAEESLELAMADEKPKEGVKIENSNCINLKVVGQDASMVQFKIKMHAPRSKLRKVYSELQGLARRQIRFQFGEQAISETDTLALWEMEDEDTIGVFQQQKKGNLLFTPDLCSSRSGKHSQLENHHSVLPHPNYYSIVFSVLSFSTLPFLYCM